MIALAISRDPVAKGVARILGLETSTGGAAFALAKRGELLAVVHNGDSTDVPPESELRGLGVEHLVVPSRHEMARPRPMLTAHTPGTPPSLSVAHASLKSWLFRRVCEERPEGYDCELEATHHGPNTERISVTFIEVGSTEREWADERALRALASALEGLAEFKPSGMPVAMSVGDLHYSLLKREVFDGVDVGHIIHKDIATADLALTALMKHVDMPKVVVIYKKSLKGDVRRAVIDALRERGVELDLRG